MCENPVPGLDHDAQEKPEPPPQPAVGDGPIGVAEPPTLMLEADITFFTSLLWHELQKTDVVSVDETIASNSFSHELQTNS